MLAVAGESCAGEYVLTDTLQLEFGPSGELVRVIGCIPGCQDTEAKRLELSPRQNVIGFAPGTASWQLQRSASASATRLEYRETGGSARRTWVIPHQGRILDFESSESGTFSIQSDGAFSRNDAHGFAKLISRSRYLRLHENSLEVTEIDEAFKWRLAEPGWSGFRNHYWSLLVQTQQELEITGGDTEPLRLDFQSETPYRLAFYIGPVEPRALKSAAPELGAIMYAALWAPFRWICFGLYYLLEAIHLLVPWWPLAIIILSVSVTFLMWPLSRIADRLQQEVQATEARLAPRIAAIKSEWRGEEQAERILELYRSENVHPLYSLKSMAGIAVVIPVFIGAFDMLAENIWLAGESFLWVADLSRPDSVAALPFNIPFFGDELNVLPFLMTALSVCASYLHQVDPNQPSHTSPQLKRLFLLAFAFLLLFYTFPAGMVLYWTTNNAIAVLKGLGRNYFKGKTIVNRESS